MHRTLYLILALGIIGCAGSPTDDEEVGAETCLENPALAKKWGECNVKKTIYDRRKKLDACVKYTKQPQESILKIKLFANGKVQNVVFEDSLGEKKSAKCLKREFLKMKFAPPPSGVNPTIMYPLAF